MMLVLILILLYNFILVWCRHPNEIFYDMVSDRYFLIIDNSFCQIANDNFTLEYLGFVRNQSSVIGNIFHSDFVPNDKLSCPIKLRPKSGSLCHNFHKKVLEVSNILNNHNRIVLSTIKYGNYFNPALLPLRNGQSFLLTQRNNPKLGILSKNLKLLKELKYETTEPVHFYESDYRLIEKSNGNIILVFTKEHFSPHVYSAIRELSYDATLDKYYLSASYKLNVINPGLKEKNWIPFVYNNEIYFIRHIYPLEIVKLNETIVQTSFMNLPMLGYNVSEALHSSCNRMNYCSGYNWMFGELRGGTPALYIPSYGYLGFFHSATYFCHYLYIMGSYLLSSTMPFRILKISHYPIVDNDLIYDFTNWNHGMSVIFPMSFYMEDSSGNIVNDEVPETIVLSLGYNDTEGLIARIDFKNLIDSMFDVSC